MITMTFDLTKEQYDEKEGRLVTMGQKNGFDVSLETTINGTLGNISGRGIVASYVYDGKSLLTVTVLHEPIFLPESVIKSKITEWFSEK